MWKYLQYRGTVAWLKWQSTFLASARPWIQKEKKNKASLIKRFYVNKTNPFNIYFLYWAFMLAN
jgi:hypothetical protein